jgi:hypothetical protein
MSASPAFEAEEVAAWCDAVGLSPAVVPAVHDHIRATERLFGALGHEGRTVWLGQQEALDRMIEDAKAALRIATGNKLAAALETSVAMVDPWMLATLQNHWRAHQDFSKRRK